MTDSIGRGIAGAEITGFSAGLDSLGVWSTDASGVGTIDNGNVTKVLVQKEGYSPVFRTLTSAGPDTVVMAGAVSLREFTVSTSDLMFRTYPLTRAQMRSYSNVYTALNTIPTITVLSNGQLFLEGSPNVKILLNGVETDQAEIAVLSKDDIKSVQISSNPPMHYAVEGVTGVINIITKENLTGGNIGLDIDQAFHPFMGKNSLGMFYNWGRSRLSILAKNENRHFRQSRYSQELDYDFGGVHYNKTKRGLDSKNTTDNNELTATYQNYHHRDYLIFASAGTNFEHRQENNKQQVTSYTSGDEVLADNFLRVHTLRPWARAYFEKYIKDGDMRFMGNLRYQHQNSDFTSFYHEQDAAQSGPATSGSDYKILSNAVFGEMQYEIYPRWGGIVFDIYGRHQWSNYTDRHENIREHASFIGLDARVGKKLGKFSFWAGIGALGRFNGSSITEQNRNLYSPTPSVNLYYSGIPNSRISFSYSMTTSGARISELSETPQWLDTRLVYHGNAALRPYRQQNFGLFAYTYGKYFDLNFRSNLTIAPGMICNHYISRPDYILETLVNLDSYTELYGQADFTIKPLGTSRLEFTNRLIGGIINGRGPSYHWHGYRYQWMCELVYRTERWTFDAFYQLPGKVAVGQLIMPRGQVWTIGAAYRPNDNLSIGLNVCRPFAAPFRESQRTVGSALVSNAYISEIGDWRNFVSLKVSWNISFGRRNQSRGPLMDNYIDDEGVLVK